ncbi:MAG: hypothetical protein WC634_04985 [archaeon]
MKKLFVIAFALAALALSGCIQPVPDSSGQQPPINTGIESCGSMDITRLATAIDLTKEEMDALACFNRKMVDCAEASFGLTGQLGGLFSVVGAQKSNCLISYYDNTDETQKTCIFTKSFLSATALSAEQMEQPKFLIMAVAAGMKGMQYANPVTGETNTIECTAS